MYIKKSGSMLLINLDHFDGGGAEESDKGICQIYLFKANAEYSKLKKSILLIGRYSKEQTESILAGIEKSMENHEIIHTIPVPEVKNA